jgi:D-sedoheptulose 7-phosphate isomerase
MIQARRGRQASRQLWPAIVLATIRGMSRGDPILAALEESSRVLAAFLGDQRALENVRKFARAAASTLGSGGLLMACGNGGSMCDAMHFAEEWTGRFRNNRRPLPAIAFSDASQLTCIANDFGYDEVFARSVEAFGKKGDLLVAISTSGESKNVLRAVEVAKSKGIVTVGLLGRGGGRALGMVDIPVVVPLATGSDRIQEVHIKVLHIGIETVERALFPTNYAAAAQG